ncbi:MAG: hypothetical protein RLZZ436_2998 [Planctomycetota bacterium]
MNSLRRSDESQTQLPLPDTAIELLTSHFSLLTSHFSLPHGAPVLLSTFYPLLSRAACDTCGAAPSAAAPHRVNLVDTVDNRWPSRAPEWAEALGWFRTLVPTASASRRRTLYPQAAARRLIAFSLLTSHFSLLTSHFSLLTSHFSALAQRPAPRLITSPLCVSARRALHQLPAA